LFFDGFYCHLRLKGGCKFSPAFHFPKLKLFFVLTCCPNFGGHYNIENMDMEIMLILKQVRVIGFR
ncbi:MAG: hypothetical protein LBT27_09970, partial [Prevotellaceae bacterium]|nr:hypothetical protein [Prevotellaceae bacterium]